jgi:hypothetical protein
MSGGGEPGGLNGAGRPEPARFALHLFHLAPCALQHPVPCCSWPDENKVGPAGLTFGRNFLKIFVKFFECIFSKIKHALVKTNKLMKK